MKENEKKIYSQNGEDGIIEHIFKKIGTTNKIAVEFGVTAGGNGSQTNTRYLLEQGWTAYWFDIEKIDNILPNCIFKVKFLTTKNIIETFKESNIPNEFDLLSIDIDGNDYHIREALSEYSPRVCIMEYNGYYPPTVEYVMNYNESYRWKGKKDISFGASLLSYTKQANRLGYDLVYCDKNGVNVFFIRRDINVFPVLTAEEVYVKLYWTAEFK
jgi:hypothetical protein